MGRYDQNPKVYAKWLKEGRGQGTKQNYKPWLYVYNVPSRGRSHRVWSNKIGRLVHCLSDLELSAYFLLEWSPTVVDIREQFPLSLDITLPIAKRLGFKHPALRGHEIIMTTDFLVSTPNANKPYKAFQIKPEAELCIPRVREKLAIEKESWNSINIDFEIVSEDKLNLVKTRNLKWLLPHTKANTTKQELAESVKFWASYMLDNPGEKLLVLTQNLDSSRRAEYGTALAEIRDLFALRAASFDMTIPFYTLTTDDISFLCRTGSNVKRVI